MYQVTENSTVHGLGTPHGRHTPHRFPTYGFADLTSVLAKLALQLYPTGRAFYMPKNGVTENTHLAFNKSYIRLVNDANLTIDSTFPDNDNFSLEDCSLWEYRFGIVSNPLSSLVDRRKAIYRRMGRGRNVLARQSAKYIEYQLQTAGFDVYIYENGFIEGGVKVFKRPQDIVSLVLDVVQHGGTSQHGIGLEHGFAPTDVIANSYKPNELYSVPDNKLWATFFIGGASLGIPATISANREEEFRELVLKLKPAHLVAFPLINYV